MRNSIVILWVMAALLSFAPDAFAADAQIFNPYLHAKLPSESLKGESAQMARSLGGKSSSLQDEVQYRKHWRQEVYPVVFGNAKAAHEVLVFLDYAVPQSQHVWAHVVQASHYMTAQDVHISVFARSKEPYAIELMGGGIWMAHSHPTYALDYYTHTLLRWNAAKQGLAAQGIRRPFVTEYDATEGMEIPILYAYLERVGVHGSQQFSIVKYAFDAGNINMYQANIAAQHYGIQNFPAVVVNGKRIANVSAQNILDALH